MYLACFPCLQILPEKNRRFPSLTTSLFLCRAPLWMGSKKNDPIKEHPRGKNAHQSHSTHFWASFDRMTALFVSKPTPFGWQMALSLWRGTRFCSSLLEFSLQSSPCSHHCQSPSQVQMLDQHWRSSEGRKTGRATAGERRKQKEDGGVS